MRPVCKGILVFAVFLPMGCSNGKTRSSFNEKDYTLTTKSVNSKGVTTGEFFINPGNEQQTMVKSYWDNGKLHYLSSTLGS